MLIEKIQFEVYIRNISLLFSEKYILIHTRKTTTDFLLDKEDWERWIKSELSLPNVDSERPAFFETLFEKFWQGMRGYCIVYNNDDGIRNSHHRIGK
jgi:hypothetical protein